MSHGVFVFCFEKRILVFLDALGKGDAVENAAAESDFRLPWWWGGQV